MNSNDRYPSKVEKNFEVPQNLLERALREFKLPDYKAFPELPVRDGKIESQVAYTIKAALKLVGGDISLDTLVENNLISFWRFEEEILIPGGELMRVIDRPKKKELYTQLWIKDKYGLSGELVKRLIDCGTLKQDSEGNISGERLQQLYDLLAKRKFRFKELPKESLRNYKRYDLPVGVQKDQQGKLEPEKYFSVLYLTSKGSGFFYVIKPNEGAYEMQSKFVNLANEWHKIERDSIAAHWSDEDNSYYFGGFYTKRPIHLRRFLRKMGFTVNRIYSQKRPVKKEGEAIKITNENLQYALDYLLSQKSIRRHWGAIRENNPMYQILLWVIYNFPRKSE